MKSFKLKNKINMISRFDEQCGNCFGFIISTGKTTSMLEKFNYQTFYDNQIEVVENYLKVKYEVVI